MERHTKNIQEPRGAVRDIQHSRYSRKSNIVCKHFLKVTSWHEWVGSKLHHWVLTQALLPRSLQTLSQSLIPHQAKHHIWTYIYIYKYITSGICRYMTTLLRSIGFYGLSSLSIFMNCKWTHSHDIGDIGHSWDRFWRPHRHFLQAPWMHCGKPWKPLRCWFLGNAMIDIWSIYGRFVAKHV